MKLHYFEHVPYEGLDRVGVWATQRGHGVSVTRFHAGDPLPELASIDALLIMGGPMGVYEAERFPWMKEEMHFIRQAIQEKKKVLGICLGSQLIAGALGANVYPHTQKEIGWWPVRFRPEAQKTPLKSFGTEAMMYHWHGDTFDLPKEAVWLASSAACKHQAYAIGNHVMALQCHPEITRETIGRWVQESGSIKNPSRFVMSEEQMTYLADGYLAVLGPPLFQFLDDFFTAPS